MQLATFVWVGQGILSVVALWGWSELADRIRTGDVTADLLRPVHPVLGYLAPDLGRAGYTLLARFVPPLTLLPAALPARQARRDAVGGHPVPRVAAPARVALLLLAPVARAVFFGSIFVASASLAFWWVESGEVGNAFTYGGRDFTAYPVSVYGGWFPGAPVGCDAPRARCPPWTGSTCWCGTARSSATSARTVRASPPR